MSTSYPHYYLFLLPSFSILFAFNLTSFKFKYSFSKAYIRSLLIIIISLILFVFLFAMYNYNELIFEYSRGKQLIIYILSAILLSCYVLSIRFLFDFKSQYFNLINFFYNIVIPQYIYISLLFNLSILGNPNQSIKLFLKNEIVSSIVNNLRAE